MIWERHFTFYAMTNFGRIMKCYWPHSIKLFVVNTMSCTHDITRIWLSNTTDYSFICMLPYCRRHALSIDTTCVNDRNRGGRASLSWFIVLSSYVLSCSNQICSLPTHWVCKWLLIISGHLHRLLSLYCFPPKYPCFPLLPPFSLLLVPLPTSWWTQLTWVTARYAIKSLWYWKTMCCKRIIANWNQDISCFEIYLSAASLRKAFCICIS